MIGASLLLAFQLVAQSSAATGPQILLDRLGSPRYADRETAARALESLGREAIPVLQNARGSRDMEVRTRAAALLQRIEGSLLTRPTLVWLRFDDAPLADVVQALNRQSGMNICLVPEILPRWKRERLSLNESQPLPFWKAIDRVCAAYSVHYDLELRGSASRGQATLALTDRNPQPVHPVCDHGPFRVNLVRLEFQRRVEFAAARPLGKPGPAGLPVAKEMPAPPRPRPVTSDQCSVQLFVTAEPRLSISQTGPLQILEARDDLGNSLRMEIPGPSLLARNADYLGGSCSSVVHVAAPLNRPEKPGRMIKILRGSVPLRITARQPDPVVVPLATAAGKAFDTSDLHVLIHEVPRRPQQQSEADRADRSRDSPGGPSRLR